MKLLVKGGRVVDPASGRDAVGDVFIVDGRIAPGGGAPDRTLDAGGLVVAPGLIDLSARLREPGYEHKATLESEMDAAVAGGVTSLACPPDTDPPLDEPGLVDMLRRRAKPLRRARVYPVGALTVIPCDDPALLGVATHRGALLPVVFSAMLAPKPAAWATTWKLPLAPRP